MGTLLMCRVFKVLLMCLPNRGCIKKIAFHKPNTFDSNYEIPTAIFHSLVFVLTDIFPHVQQEKSLYIAV